MTKTEWIPVSEKSPPLDGEYLVIHDDGLHNDLYEIGWFDSTHKIHWSKAAHTSGDYIDATHWMPLPSPPKGEEK